MGYGLVLFAPKSKASIAAGAANTIAVLEIIPTGLDLHYGSS